MKSLTAQMTKSQKRLAWIAVAAVGVLLLVWVATLVSGQQYLRTAVSQGVRDQADEENETLTSNTWITFQAANIPFTFDVPAEWKAQVKASSDGSSVYVDLKNIKLWYYPSDPPETDVMTTQLLGQSTRELLSYPAKIGSTAGTMWARENIVEDTKAPIGQRVYVPEIKSGVAVLLLPAPPYTDIQLRIINSFTAR